jgi:hypothetical protein
LARDVVDYVFNVFGKDIGSFGHPRHLIPSNVKITWRDDRYTRSRKSIGIF